MPGVAETPAATPTTAATADGEDELFAAVLPLVLSHAELSGLTLCQLLCTS
jgi:hypothetical protein